MNTFNPTKELLEIPEVDRIEWAEALESGKYEQGNKRLFKDGCYCCLGVYQSIKGVSDERMNNACYPQNIEEEVRLDDKQTDRIPAAYFVEDGDHEDDDDHETYFAALNDNYVLSFKQIAQLLRGNTVIME